MGGSSLNFAAMLTVTVMLSPAGPAQTAPLPLKSYVQRSADGSWIDWYLGRVGASGETLIFRSGYKANQGIRAQTENDADMDGRRRLLRMLGEQSTHDGIPIRESAPVSGSLTAWLDSIKGHNPTETGSGMRTSFLIPLWGGVGPDGDVTVMKSVLMPLAPAPVAAAGGDPAAPPEAASPDVSGGGPASGLVIDATGLQNPAPSFFPRVLTGTGEVLYSYQSAEIEYAYFRGLAAYATLDPSGEPGPPVLSPREGHQPIRVTATGVAGAARSDLIVSAEDGRRIAAAAAAAPFLRECRVLVLMPPPPPPPRPAQPRRKAPLPPASPPAADPNRH